MTKEIHLEKTLTNLYYNKCIFFFTLSDINLSKLNTNFDKIPRILRLSPVLFQVRVIIYHMFIASSKAKPSLNILLMLCMELTLGYFFLKIFLSSRRILNVVTILAKMFQSVTMAIFLTIAWILSQKEERDITPVNEPIQNFAIKVLLCNILLEYVFVMCSLATLFTRLVWNRLRGIKIIIGFKKHIIYYTKWDKKEEKVEKIEKMKELRKKEKLEAAERRKIKKKIKVRKVKKKKTILNQEKELPMGMLTRHNIKWDKASKNNK